MKTLQFLIATALALLQGSMAFVAVATFSRQSTRLFAEEAAKAGPLVSGEELELLLTNLEQPLVIDAYATWLVFEATALDLTINGAAHMPFILLLMPTVTMAEPVDHAANSQASRLDKSVAMVQSSRKRDGV